MQSFNRYQFEWGRGVVVGALTFCLGFLLTRHFVLLGPLPQTAYDASEITKVGWLFFNAHTVHLTESATFFGETMTVSGHDFISREGASEYLTFLHTIPPLTLVLGGVLSAVGWPKTRTLSFAALNGTSIAVGYCLAVIVAVFLFSATETAFGASGTIRPAPLYAILVGGLVYPLVFGGLGGVVYFLSQGSIRLQVR
ncbi:hypothetical protein HWV07_10750 [Natronomonas salina]|uniref:hypothetical protein n=1 Tax=Natronomonas salina TaxID=1710540 RepID=UPI0015B4C34A|nr:hypothetical protein [Natronomonas salina]QLD89480.1 hypothetical protein HWV07_10750 [Natronomonas salina]